MQWTPEHKQQLAHWISEGLSLSELQVHIRETFGESLTYMETRFLLDDLELELQEKESPQPVEPKPDTQNETAQELEPTGMEGEVHVSVDAVQRPGALVSGSVTFSDGVTASWQLDQLGRLGIIPAQDGYRPPESDMAAFQVKLEEALRAKGF